MSDLPSLALLQQSHATPKTGSDLELFGKAAASKFLCGECSSLSTSVVETVKKAGLSPEQVRRVVEFTNTDAFLQEFKKEGSSKVIEFQGGPANYSDVLKDLNDGGGGTVFDKGNLDYQMPPPDTAKTASLNRERLGLEETKLAEAFGVDESPLPYAEPLQDSLDVKEKLARAYDEFTGQINQLESQYMTCLDGLYNNVKQAALGGTTLGQVVSAWSTVTAEPEFVKAAFSQLTPRLLQSGVFLSKEAIGESLIKTASAGVVNEEHPLVQDFALFCETLSKLAAHRGARDDVSESLDQISTFLKAASVKEVASGLKGAWKGLSSAAEKAAPGAGRVAGKSTEFAVKHSPKALAGTAGVAGYQKVKDSPTTHRVLSFVPGTRQHKIRQYYKQQRRRG